jgi:hypothetical protein
MALASVCPECGALLEQTWEFPGGVDATIQVECPDCTFEEAIAPEQR